MFRHPISINRIVEHHKTDVSASPRREDYDQTCEFYQLHQYSESLANVAGT